jgi:hypothetical protein
MDVRSEDRRSFPGLGSDPQSVRTRVEAMERLLERAITIPGTKQTVGLDVILDLVPFAGSTAAAVLGAYMAWEARNLRIIKRHLDRHHAGTATIEAKPR